MKSVGCSVDRMFPIGENIFANGEYIRAEPRCQARGRQMTDRRGFLQVVVGALALPRVSQHERAPVDERSRTPNGAKTGGHHVYPNQEIQAALEAAARDP